MINFIVYDFTTGRILRWGRCPAYSKHMQARDGEIVYEGSHLDPELWYFTGLGQPAERPSLDIDHEYTIAADGIEALEIALPAGTKIIDMGTREVFEDEEELYFSTEIVGTSSFRVVPPMPYREFEVTIHAA